MDELKGSKTERVLVLYTKLLNGQVVNKAQEALNYGVNERSIQRDIDALRDFLREQYSTQDVIYDRKSSGYRLVNNVPPSLTNSEILAVCKILLESRSMRKDEMLPILDKLIDCCVPKESRQAVIELMHSTMPICICVGM